MEINRNKDEINIVYSPCPASSYFDLLNSAYTGKLDRFKMKASFYDSRKEGLAIAIPRLVDGDGRGSLAFAAAGGRVDVCRYLLEELNLDVDVEDYHGDRKIQTLLLSKGIHINAATTSGTALSYAVVLGQFDAVKVLLDHHADPNVVMSGAVTPLASAIVNNSLQIRDLLLQAGADPNAESRGIAPLLYAVDHGRTQCNVRLLEAGADPNVTDNEGMTAVEIAAKEGNSEIVEILFPVTSCIPTYPNWTIGGLMEHVHSEAAKKKKKKPEGYETFLQAKMKGAEAFQEKQYSLAATWYSKALEVAPTDASLLSNRSDCYARMQDGPEALRDATECISLRPGWPKAYYREGVALNILKGC
ncbi:hypothetical protein MKW98_001887 [Papaver atlanticum]|uniref:Uncharacterized protein n=1 Tax=Papaver atlanticum TaxID=357466 RepID=A0AAD4T467_9MAGN|nr:hypothetical protein MKW98_001887 [Papaver atlanticum]